MTAQSTCFSWRQAVSKSELVAEAKHLLLTLSLFMNEEGAGCFPSVSTLEERCSRSRPWVIKHLKIVRQEGWLTVEQHGYRGQKWKRNEYVARWPELDISAPICSGEDVLEVDEIEGEGGKRSLPPSGSEGGKSQSEGGKSQSEKVVNQINSNCPVNYPVNSPTGASAREREISDDGEGDKKSIERHFKRFAPTWPTWIDSSEPAARKVWFELSSDDRAAAEGRMAEYVDASKAAGRKIICSLQVYLREKRWEKLGEAATAEPTQLQVAAYGKAWWQYRSRLLKHGPTHAWKPTRFQQKMIDQGKGDILAPDKAKAEFPRVTALDAEAKNSRGPMLPAGEVAELAAGEIAKVKVGSDTWVAFCELHRKRDWPQPELPPHIQFVDLPKGAVDQVKSEKE